jgi:hypothetical protein
MAAFSVLVLLLLCPRSSLTVLRNLVPFMIRRPYVPVVGPVRAHIISTARGAVVVEILTSVNWMDHDGSIAKCDIGGWKGGGGSQMRRSCYLR